jgi:hypothetical protein
MLSALMAEKLLSPEALEAALGSVIDRLSPSGQVAHEEDIGSFAERRHLLELPEGTPGRSEKARTQEPIFDYKMMDGEFMLPVLLARYAAQVPDQRVQALLSRRTPTGESRGRALERNLQFVLDRAKEYDGKPTSLLRIRKGEFVGDWRDSNAGLGGGVYPGSVNIDLVTNALKAIETLRSKGVAGAGVERPELEPLVSKWTQVEEHFQEHLSADVVRQRLREFMELPSNQGQAARLLAQDLGPSADGTATSVTLSEFLAGQTPASLKEGFGFQALALDEQGRRIPVPNSDSSLRLFLGDPSPEALAHLLPALELPYPVGLMTPAGALTANPAYANKIIFTAPTKDQTKKTAPLTEWLDRSGYHGTVIWMWQQNMLQLGLMRQIERLAPEPGNEELVSRMRRVLSNLREANGRLGDLSNSELLTIDDLGRATSFGQTQGDTESNAVQLWSTTAPAVQLAYQDHSARMLHTSSGAH